MNKLSGGAVAMLARAVFVAWNVGPGVRLRGEVGASDAL